MACKKTDPTETQVTRLENKWLLTKIATDDNANGNIDSYEIHPVASGQTDILQFMNTGSGLETSIDSGKVFTYPFTWTFSTDTVYRVGEGHDIINYILADISSSTLELTTTVATSNGGSILAAYFYKRD